MLTYLVFLLPALKVSEFFSKREMGRSGVMEPGTRQSIGYGLRGSLSTGIALHVIGCWFRYLGGTIFIVVGMGQFFAAICQAFTLGMPPLLARVWFRPDEQNIAISIGVTANIFGCAAGFLLTPFAVGTTDINRTIPNYLLYQAIAYSVPALAILLFFPEAPKTSQVNNGLITRPIEPITSVIWRLSKMQGFLFLVVGYGAVVGGQFALQTLQTTILPVFSTKTEMEIGWLGFWMLMSGILASLVSGIYLDYSKRYLSFSILNYITTILSLLMIYVALETQTYLVVTAGSILYGISTSSLTSGLSRYAIVYFNLTHDESIISGLLNGMAQIIGIALISGMPLLEPEATSQFPMALPFGILVAGTTLGLPLLLVSQNRMLPPNI
ncbi:Feline leukemia virus subgroup C receptor- protein 2 [Entomophthora muscae]|uniref:Feline leukemia virus subgroup C receptor-protein 2 n=1 Tax=Entomophthora muscae TaxID=34485 RepID=A0ACC2TDS5_9FUNG|nr:Feline leukemia virus subgroup C receptor- protein 2 [Entomophthora muscae]